MLLAVATLVVLPALWAFVYITAFGVNVAFFDDFQFVPYIAALQFRTLTFQALFALHNDHRILFPRIVMLITASVTHFNTKAEMYLYWLCLCLICGLFLLTLKQAQGLTPRSLLLFAPVSFTVFSLRQWENLLWGWQICWGMAVLFSILAFYLLAVRSRTTLCFILALVSGAIASFSLLTGLLVWPVGLLELFYLRRLEAGQRWWWYRFAVWSMVGAAVFVAYFHGFVRAAYVPYPLFFLHQPVQAFGYFLAAVGAPLASTLITAMMIGGLLCALLIFALLWQVRGRAARSLDMSLAVATFGVAAAGVLTVGRSGYGLDEALSSRFTLPGLIGIGGLYLWIVMHLGWERRTGAVVSALMLAVLIVGTVTSYRTGLSMGQVFLTARRVQAGFLRGYTTVPDAGLVGVSAGSPARFLLPQLVYMSTERLNIFYGSQGGSFAKPTALPAGLPNAGPSAGLGINEVNGVLLPPSGLTIVVGAATDDVLLVTGWAVDSASGRPAGGVFVDIDNGAQIPAAYGFNRPDVAGFFNNDSYAQTGFRAAFLAREFGPGRHTLSFRILSEDRSRYYQPDYRLILEVR
jgi:hypothetical protein